MGEALKNLQPLTPPDRVGRAGGPAFKTGGCPSTRPPTPPPPQTLLFIGDSITDCGRRDDVDGLGDGYVRLIRDYLLAKNPATAPRVVNAGVSGDQVTDLAARWKTDVLDHRPDAVSIKVGINDVWHGLSGGTGGVPLEQFTGVYHAILRQLHMNLPHAKLVLCEPSVIEPPAPAEGNARLLPYVRAVREIAREFNAVCCVPLHSTFIQARKTRPDIAWTPDGVHPSSAGHMLIARAWLSCTKLL